MRPLRLALPVAFALGAAPPAQDQPRRTSQETPVFSSDVSLVLLPVFVIDKEGKAVRGLTATDFDVQQDGRKAEVVSFRYVDTTDTEDQDELLVASAARRRFLLLFDKSFTDLPGLDRARRAASDFVRRRLAASDLAAVATFDVQNGVRLVANFTDDRALLSHAIATLGVPSLARINDPLGLAMDIGLTDLQGTGPSEEGQGAPQALIDSVARVMVVRMRAADEQVYQHNVNTLLDALDTLARALRGVEGRKQVLYFSAGFDARVLVGQWGADQRAAGEAVTAGRLWEVDSLARFGDSRVRESLANTTRSLAAADTVVHSIDVTGLGTDRSLTQTAVSQDLTRDTTNRESLGFFAHETGGRLFDNANNLGPALAEMLEMTSRYYVLGIQPDVQKQPGAFHKLKVKVARKGVKLSHRPGYFERPAPGGERTTLQRQFDLAELVVTGGDGRNDLPFTSLCLPFPSPGEKQTLGLVVQVPRASLPWTSSEPVGVEVYGYAVADDGTVYDHLAQSLRLDPARADPQGRAQGVSLYGTFEVPPGRYTIRLLVREAASGKSSLRMLDVTVPPYDGRAVFALPPLVLDEDERWLKLELGQARKPSREAPPFQLDARPFVPRTSFEVRPGSKERLVLMVFDPEQEGDPAADVEIRSSLTASDGRAVQPGRLKIERVLDAGDGRRTFVFSYLPEDVGAGDYTLKIGLGESGGFAQSYALLRFRQGS
jgi:VWFA-related protein